MPLFRSLAILLTVIVLVGLYKPWIVFWWSDFSNRKKVLKFYGTTAAVIWMLYLASNQ